MKKVKGFNYDTIKDKHIIEHIDNQPNRSKYILSLVEEDMKGNSIEEIVNRQIEKYLEGFEIKKEHHINTEDVLDILKIGEVGA